MVERLEAKVIGKVQGVSYRAFAASHAESLGLQGYAKNCQDGSVEVIAEGEKIKLELLVAELKRGPGLAIVEKVEARYTGKKGGFGGFSIR